MGLLDLFLSNQSTLDVEQVPQQGNGPIGTPTGEFNTGTTPFQQQWSSEHPYVNSFVGSQNNSIQPPTLAETGLDIDNPSFVPSTTTPNTLTAYPATAKGGLGQSALQFIQIWNPIINYNDVVAGTNNSILESTLSETGLNNNDPDYTPTTSTPNIETSYPWMASGPFGYASSQYSQNYSPIGNGVNGYLGDNSQSELNNLDTNPQIITLSETSLNTNNNNYSATVNPLSIQTNYPFFTKGRWRGNALQFSQIWSPNFVYVDNYDSQTQVGTLPNTSLDNTIPASQNTTYPTPDANSYPNYYPTVPPQVGMGMFGFGAGQYYTQYNSNGEYYSQIIYDQIITTSGNNLVTYTPISGLSPNNNGVASFNQSYPFNQTYLGTPGFPELVTGQFNGSPDLAQNAYNVDNTYLNNTPIQDPNSTQTITLSRTGLDNTDPSFVETTFVPNNLSAPNEYPFLVSGEFNGAPSQYSSPYNANNTYLDSNFINAQEGTLDLTGLDNTNENSLPTTSTPTIAVATPTVLPPQTYMGEFGGAPSTFTNTYSPNNGYLNNIIIQDPNSPQVNTLGETGLDNTNDIYLETTFSPLPINVPTQPQLPLNATVNMNPSGSAVQFTQKYKPSSRYLDIVDALPIGDK